MEKSEHADICEGGGEKYAGMELRQCCIMMLKK